MSPSLTPTAPLGVIEPFAPAVALMTCATWLTVTVKLQFALFPFTSVAVTFTVVVPIGKVSPEFIELLTVGEPHASEEVIVKVTAVPELLVVEVVMSEGQVTDGASLSVTVTVWVQVAVLP